MRIRPFNKREKGLDAKAVTFPQPDGKTIEMQNPAVRDSKDPKAVEAAKKSFGFDFVYPWE